MNDETPEEDTFAYELDDGLEISGEQLDDFLVFLAKKNKERYRSTPSFQHRWILSNVKNDETSETDANKTTESITIETTESLAELEIQEEDYDDRDLKADFVQQSRMNNNNNNNEHVNENGYVPEEVFDNIENLLEDAAEDAIIEKDIFAYRRLSSDSEDGVEEELKSWMDDVNHSRSEDANDMLNYDKEMERKEKETDRIRENPMCHFVQRKQSINSDDYPPRNTPPSLNTLVARIRGLEDMITAWFDDIYRQSLYSKKPTEFLQEELNIALRKLSIATRILGISQQECEM